MADSVVFDFDGVINSYVSGWIACDVIPDPPVSGIREAIRDIRAAGYRVIVVSARCTEEAGIKAIREYLDKYEIEVDDIMADKPPAKVYIDDRGLCFTGHPELLLEQIRNFKPWWQ